MTAAVAMFIGFLLAVQSGQDSEAPSEGLKKKRAAVVPGAPKDTGESLAVQSDKVDGLTLTRLAIPGAAVETLPLWSKDGRTLWILEKKGTLRRIQTPAFREDRLVELGVEGTHLGLSAEGLIFHVKDLEEVWVIDKDRLTVKARHHAPRIYSISTAPNISLAFGAWESELRILDLKKGGWAAKVDAGTKWREWKDRITRHPEASDMRSFVGPAVSPAGDQLFWASGSNHWRASIRGASIAAEEAGPGIGSTNACRVVFSHDSQLVAFHYYGGNQQPSGWPHLGNSGIYLFKSSDLQRPVAALADVPLKSFSIDKAAEWIYTQGRDHRLLIWSLAGTKLNELLPGPGSPTFIVSHPEGRKLLMQTGSDLLWVEIPRTLAPNVGKSDPAGPSAGKSEAPNVPAVGKKLSVDGLEMTELKVASSNPNSQNRITASLWHPSGRWIYLADSEGFVTRLSVPDLKEVRRILVGAKVETLALSKGALLTMQRVPEGVTLLDPESLDIKTKIPIPGLKKVSTSPASSMAIGDDGSYWVVADLVKTDQVRKVSPSTLAKEAKGAFRHPEAAPLGSSSGSLMTPDGRYVFCPGESLHRFAVKHSEFIYEEAGPNLQTRWHVISPDSRYIAVGVPGGLNVLFHPPLKGEGVYIYKVTDLSEPVMALETDYVRSGLDFDVSRKRLVRLDREAALLQYAADGSLEKEFLPWRRGTCQGSSIQMSPAGRWALVFSSRGIYLAKFPE